MKFEEKVEMGKKAVTMLTSGVDFEEVLMSLIVACGFDEAIGEAVGKKVEETDPMEILILGINEKSIDDIADQVYKSITNTDDTEAIESYKKLVAGVRKTCIAIGKPEIADNFIPVKTLLGMGLCKAGERLMRGE